MSTIKSEKVTNRVALAYALDNLPDAPADVREKWQKMIDQLDKKNASPKKMTEKQEKNEGIKAEILDFLTAHEGEGFTCSDLLKEIPSLEGDSNQHVSALMRALVLTGSVEKYTEKRRTYFKAVVEG